jgi:Amidohydrolase
MFRWIALLVLATLPVTQVRSQTGERRPPVIDMHVHGTSMTPQQALAEMKSLNIRYMFVANLADDLPEWAAALDRNLYLPSLTLPCPAGRAAFIEKRCWSAVDDFPDLTWLRKALSDGRIAALGEMVPQLLGISPNDERLEPMWQLGEEFDVPVAIHMGPGPPAAAYESSPSLFKFPKFHMSANDPLLLEDVLLRHKRLRLLVMHAGWPFLDSTLALLYAHPNVYVDVGALQAEFMVPRAAYFRHLRGLVDGGFSKRIVFGSDFPAQVEAGIDAILAADFLSPEQKADILCNNAVRFLRLDNSLCRP